MAKAVTAYQTRLIFSGESYKGGCGRTDSTFLHSGCGGYVQGMSIPGLGGLPGSGLRQSTSGLFTAGVSMM